VIDNGNVVYSNNSAIDSDIKAKLVFFSPRSQKRLKKAFLDAKKAVEKYQNENTDANARHIYREFILAYELNKHGFSFEYEKNLQAKKPDWLDLTAKIMIESYTYERGGSAPFIDRVSAAINKKCNKYEMIIESNSLRFLVAVYIDFLTFMSIEEIREDPKRFLPIFQDNYPLSAIIFFTETQVINQKQQYEFFCLSRKSIINTLPNWPFETLELRLLG
jgi:hypothetical protein